MYTPPAFREDDPLELRRMIRDARLATLVTATVEGLHATPLPLYLVEDEGAFGTLYGHVARANPQWSLTPSCEALAVFMGPDAYVTPSWYATKGETGKVVPTWNYSAVHAYGPVEFFDDRERLHQVASQLTDLHEAGRADRWALSDAPAPFVQAQLKGIIGVRMPISRIEGKRKLSQNRGEADRLGVARGLAESERWSEREVGSAIPVPGR